MKVVSYTALHYGADYLGWAIRSVIDHVDEHVILYSDVGSHGHQTDRVCPDSRETLYQIAQQAAGDKLRWIDGHWPYEGAQRDAVHEVVPDADVILVVDADEIWPTYPIKFDPQSNSPIFQRHSWRVPIIHYWRSFYRCVLHDPAYPIRIICPKVPESAGTDTTGGVINHMGYAQRAALVEYKQHVHGHKGEWRRDDWFHKVFMANAQRNCHPVGSEYWNPEPVDPWQYMPAFMKDHPYANLEVIG